MVMVPKLIYATKAASCLSSHERHPFSSDFDKAGDDRVEGPMQSAFWSFDLRLAAMAGSSSSKEFSATAVALGRCFAMLWSSSAIGESSFPVRIPSGILSRRTDDNPGMNSRAPSPFLDAPGFRVANPKL